MITPDLAAFLESGISIHAATRSARLVPDELRGVGARVEGGGEELTVFFPDATSGTARANLADNGRIAVCFSRPIDHRSYQVKGRVVALRPADDADRQVVDRYRRALVEEYARVGVPPSIAWRIAVWPAHAVRFRVEGVYAQTPGPGAGAPLARSKA